MRRQPSIERALAAFTAAPYRVGSRRRRTGASRRRQRRPQEVCRRARFWPW